jgi:hypothetical protein
MESLLLGKVYSIRARDSDGELSREIYIGSTHNTIEGRLSVHRSHYRRYLRKQEGKLIRYVTSFRVLELGEPVIEALEVRVCTPLELKRMEAAWIDRMKLDDGNCVVNTNRPGGSVDRREYYRAYYQRNKARRIR